MEMGDKRSGLNVDQAMKDLPFGCSKEDAYNFFAAVRRKKNGWEDDKHPLMFLFLGPSGIPSAKTELAKQLAQYLNKDKTNTLIRLDMHKYQEKHEVKKFLQLYDDGGDLTIGLSNCRYEDSLVLLDHVDKAHPDVIRELLQLIEKGDRGRVTAKRAVFMMTSNLACDEIVEHALQLRREAKGMVNQRLEDKENLIDITISRNFQEKIVIPILKRHFGRDEFLGRINEIVYFLPFSSSELNKLVSKELRTLAIRAQEKHSITLEWESGVEAVLAEGYHVHYGTRSIKHEVDRRVASQLAATQEQGIIESGSCVVITTYRSSDFSLRLCFRFKKQGCMRFTDYEEHNNLLKKVMEID